MPGLVRMSLSKSLVASCPGRRGMRRSLFYQSETPTWRRNRSSILPTSFPSIFNDLLKPALQSKHNGHSLREGSSCLLATCRASPMMDNNQLILTNPVIAY